MGDLLADIPAAIRGQRIYRREQSDLEGTIESSEAAASVISDAAIVSCAGWEESRRRSLEEKARSNLIVVSVCSTLVFTGLTFLTGQNIVAEVYARRAFVTFYFVSVLYFVAAVVCALKALRVSKTWIVGPEDESQSSVGALRGLRMSYLALNRSETNIKANWTDVSFACLRNAVIVLLVFTAIVIVLVTRPPRSPLTIGLPQMVPQVTLEKKPVPAVPPQCEGNSAPLCDCDSPQSKKRSSQVDRQESPPCGRKVICRSTPSI